jgi:hypothetical protein
LTRIGNYATPPTDIASSDQINKYTFSTSQLRLIRRFKHFNRLWSMKENRHAHYSHPQFQMRFKSSSVAINRAGKAHSWRLSPKCRSFPSGSAALAIFSTERVLRRAPFDAVYASILPSWSRTSRQRKVILKFQYRPAEKWTVTSLATSPYSPLISLKLWINHSASVRINCGSKSLVRLSRILHSL